jgi:hypothetical protein
MAAHVTLSIDLTIHSRGLCGGSFDNHKYPFWSTQPRPPMPRSTQGLEIPEARQIFVMESLDYQTFAQLVGRGNRPYAQGPLDVVT